MALTIERTGATLGAFVTGVDLADLDDATYAGIEDAWHEHGRAHLPGPAPVGPDPGGVRRTRGQARAVPLEADRQG